MNHQEEQIKSRQQKAAIRAGKIIKLLIERRANTKGITREELAYKLGIAPSTALRWEKGTFDISTKRFFEWYDALDADPIEIIRQATKNV